MPSRFHITFLWCIVCIRKRQWTSIKAEIPTKVCSVKRPASAHYQWHTGGKVCHLQLSCVYCVLSAERRTMVAVSMTSSCVISRTSFCTFQHSRMLSLATAVLVLSHKMTACYRNLTTGWWKSCRISHLLSLIQLLPEQWEDCVWYGSGFHIIAAL